MEPEGVTLVAALIAGLLSFFSPCVLPLVPAYLGYLTGVLANEMGSAKRLPIWLHALFFVLGFGLVFVLLGASGGAARRYPVRHSALRHTRRRDTADHLWTTDHGRSYRSPGWPWTGAWSESRAQPRSYGRSFLVGIVFAAGWTPCVGPVLTAITILAADSRTAATGALLLAVYALGLGVPFMAVAGMVDVALPLLRKMNRSSCGRSPSSAASC